MKKFFIIVSILLLTACTSQNNNIKQSKVKINNKIINVEVMATKAQQMQGLSGKEKLEENNGMLFVYQDKQIRSFWMKEMLFPIDIIWIDDNKIVDFNKNVPIPSKEKIPTVSPKKPINYVLEINAGFIDKNGFKIGDKVDIDNF